MARFQSIIYLLPELWRTLFKKRITVGYPFAPLELPEYFRGKVTIDPDLCHGCGLCARDCPASALEFHRDANRYQLVLYQDRCAYCGQCEQSCRYGAITLTAELEAATPERSMLVETVVDKPRERGN